MKPTHVGWDLAKGPDSYVEVEVRVCRWCREPSIRWTPCSCERAQEEARRIRADHR